MSRKLDIQVAKKLGYQVIETDECNGVDNYWLSKDGRNVWVEDYFKQSLPHYSTRIEDAWKVVELLKDNERFSEAMFDSLPLYGMSESKAAKTISLATLKIWHIP